jgi:hypothetical protein
MTYVPNPDDATQPTGAVAAQTAAAEFRALKGKVNSLSLAAGGRIPVRQSVLTGPVTLGVPSHCILSATLLGVDVKAGSYYAYANGFNSAGNVDYINAIGTDVLNAFGLLAVSNTSYLAANYVANATPVFSKTLAPPHYGISFNRTTNSLLHFNGTAGALATTDDFGTSWTMQGGAKLQATQIKFGSAALGGAGANNTLNGSADYVKATVARSFFDSWRVAGWVYASVLPGSGANATIRSIANASNFGINLFINNTAGTLRFGYSLSSNGTGNNIASNVVGTIAPVVNTWYFVELTFDKLAGVYRLYVNGVQEANTASVLQICPTTQDSIGALGTNASYFTGYIDECELQNQCTRPAGTTYPVPVVAPDIATAGYAPDFFSLIDWKMYSVTGPSTVSGTDPAFTAVNKLYVAEADTSATVVTALRPYAYQCRYESEWTTGVAAGTPVTVPHNIGARELSHNLLWRSLIDVPANGILAGDVLNDVVAVAGSTPMPPPFWNNRTSGSFVTGTAGNNLQTVVRSTGALAVIAPTALEYKIVVQRAF